MKKMLSNILIITLLILNIFGCEKVENTKLINADTPYYSVTTGAFERDRNVYMNLDVKIPKITYSGTANDELVDSLNANISSALTELIEEAKTNALKTYESYLESAKNNAKKDIENRITDLETKYQSVLGDTEREILSRANADDLINYSFSSMGRANTFSNLISSYSEAIPKRPNRIERPGKSFPDMNKDIEGTVNGFTGSDNSILSGPHNKNIIIVETTEAMQSETTIKIEGRPGRASRSNMQMPPDRNDSNWKPESFEKPKSQEKDKLKGESNSVLDETLETTKSNENNDIAPSEEVDAVKKDISDKKDIPHDKSLATKKEVALSTKSNIVLDDDITLDNFYRDLRRIRSFSFPDDYSLSFQYIPTTIECNYEIKCLDEDYLSLFIELRETRTTTTIKRLFYNVDLNNKKFLNLKDVLGNNFKDKSIKCITDAIEKWSDEQKSTLIKDYNIENYINEDTPFFINNNHKPVVEIEKFAITIGSTGYHEFQIA